MNILQKIAETKKEEVSRLKRERGLNSLKEGASSQKPPLSFQKAVHRPGKLSVIGELKKASPSRGVLRADFDVESLARSYSKAGVQALSVLTDTPYFQGALPYLRQAKAAAHLPVLRKDFLIDEHQVYEAREAGADAILLIVALLSPAQLKELLGLSTGLGMSSLVEVHNLKELEIALGAGTKLLGINNRNLDDFTVDLQTSFQLLKHCPAGLPVVSESGILTRDHAVQVQRAGACAILVGEAFMTAPDVESAIRSLRPEGD